MSAKVIRVIANAVSIHLKNANIARILSVRIPLSDGILHLITRFFRAEAELGRFCGRGLPPFFDQPVTIKLTPLPKRPLSTHGLPLFSEGLPVTLLLRIKDWKPTFWVSRDS